MIEIGFFIFWIISLILLVFHVNPKLNEYKNIIIVCPIINTFYLIFLIMKKYKTI